MMRMNDEIEARLAKELHSQNSISPLFDGGGAVKLGDGELLVSLTVPRPGEEIATDGVSRTTTF